MLGVGVNHGQFSIRISGFWFQMNSATTGNGGATGGSPPQRKKYLSAFAMLVPRVSHKGSRVIPMIGASGCRTYARLSAAIRPPYFSLNAGVTCIPSRRNGPCAGSAEKLSIRVLADSMLVNAAGPNSVTPIRATRATRLPLATYRTQTKRPRAGAAAQYRWRGSDIG